MNRRVRDSNLLKKSINLFVFSLLFSFNAKVFAAPIKVKVEHIYSIKNNSSYSFAPRLKSVLLNSNIQKEKEEGLMLQSSITTDEKGNRIFNYKSASIEAGKTDNIVYSYVVNVDDIVTGFKPDNLNGYNFDYDSSLNIYLQPSFRVESDNIQIKNKANEILNSIPVSNKQNPYYIIKAIYDYVQLNMNYNSTGTYSNKGALWALNTKTGSCEDYSSLMVALLRASNIPARTVTGYKIPKTSLTGSNPINLLDPSNYTRHMWVEAYINGYGWVPFDPTISSGTNISVNINYNGVVGAVTAKKGLSSPYYTGFFGDLTYKSYIKEFYDYQEYADSLSEVASNTGFQHLINASVYSINSEQVSKITLSPLKYSPTPYKLVVNKTMKDGKTYVVNNSEVTWTSNNENVAKVESDGTIVFTGKDGQVTITASYQGVSASQSLTVKSTYSLAKPLVFSFEPQILQVIKTTNGIKETLDNTKVTWKSSDETIATVTSDGTVSFTGKGGKVSITLVQDNLQYSFATTVNTKFGFSNKLIYTPNPYKLNLIYSINNIDLKDKIKQEEVVWKSSDETVATVTSDGIVTFTGKDGKVTISAAYKGMVASQTLTVKSTYKLVKPLVFSFEPQTLQITKTTNGITETLDNTKVTWKSSDETIVTVSPEGVVTFTGKGGGTTITMNDGQYKIPVSATTRLSFTNKLIYSTTPYKLNLSYKINNQEFIDKINSSEITWTSTNQKVATVSEDGTVTFTGKDGKVTILASYKGITISQTISVLSKIGLSKNIVYSATPYKIELYKITNNVKTLIDNSKVKFTVSNSNVLEIDKDGNVNFKNVAGTSIVTIEYEGKIIKQNVSVSSTAIKPATSFTIKTASNSVITKTIKK